MEKKWNTFVNNECIDYADNQVSVGKLLYGMHIIETYGVSHLLTFGSQLHCVSDLIQTSSQLVVFSTNIATVEKGNLSMDFNLLRICFVEWMHFRRVVFQFG